MLLYLLTCLQCAFQTTWAFQRVIHFTDWVVGHAHLVMFGVFSFWIYGVMVWLWPRLVGREWAKPALNTWHYWLTTVGLVTMFFTLVAAGLVAGTLQASLAPWNDILAASKPYWWLRLVSGLLMFAGFLCFAANMWLTARSKTAAAYDERRHLMPEPAAEPALLEA
jgi:cytochrome c oxidase cbb3-type subunit 1